MAKPLAVFDIDGTMLPGTTYFRVLESQVAQGVITQDCLETANAAMTAYKNKELDYEQLIAQLLEMYAHALAGKSASYIQSITSGFIANLDDFYGYVRPTVEKLRDTHKVIIISGSPHFMSNAVKEKFGIDVGISSEYEVDGDIITGNVSKYLATRDQKYQEFGRLTDDRPFMHSCAFGDSEGDSQILGAVDVAICIHPTEGLIEIAGAQGWIIENDLAVLNSVSVLPSVSGA